MLEELIYYSCDVFVQQMFVRMQMVVEVCPDSALVLRTSTVQECFQYYD